MSLPSKVSYSLSGLNEGFLNKVDWPIDISQAALLIHDMQNYFINIFDREKDPIHQVILNIQNIITAARMAEVPIFYSNQPANQSIDDRALLMDFWGSGLKDCARDVEIIEDLTPDSNDYLLTKWRYSAFKKTDFEHQLNMLGRKHIIIVGVYGYIGCLSTALEAFMLDIKPYFIVDAIADFNIENHLKSANYVANFCGFVTNTERLMSDLKRFFLKQHVASVLEMNISEINEDVYLPDLGLDSIRMMQIVEKFKDIQVSYLDLAQNPKLSAWYSMLA